MIEYYFSKKEGDPMPADKNRQPNRLIKEKSPYLLQHAYNPVDWHPWGEEVFEKAERENKPIFLSIGYSTCHWCHVHKGSHINKKNRGEPAIKLTLPISVCFL